MTTQLNISQPGEETQVGSYFIANYPPFSAWTVDKVPDALAALDSPPTERGAPLGLYLHIPFCRTRCKFCYFRVYTDKNARDVDTYLDALTHEVALYAAKPVIAGRDFKFVYFGGGTPSFLSSRQLEQLVDCISRYWSWDKAEEVTFECEPGTLKKSKLETIRSLGVTRLSLGIEHYDDEVLALNGRAHRSAEVFQAYDWAREVGFSQINIDLIAGMMGDTRAKWEQTVHKALAMQPDNLTIYQMEVPYNSLLAQAAMAGGATAVPDWTTKRSWVDYAFGVFEDAGYRISSGYTLVKPPHDARFVYRDCVWRGADMIGTGVASFSHVQGVHFQNEDHWEAYVDRVSDGRLPLARALAISDRQRLIRELVLQTKLGALDAGYFLQKFGVNILDEFRPAFELLESEGMIIVERDGVRLTRAGLLRVDALLPVFFEPRFRNARYT